MYYEDNMSGVYYSVISPPPKHMLVVLGGYPLLLMACFLCFMGRNLLTRDEFFRIHEVVDARPLSNFRLLASKITALVIVGWIPMVVFLGLIQLFAFLQNFIDFNIAASFDTVPLLKFLLFTCPMTLSFVAVLSLFFNVVFRNNLLTMAALLGTVIGGYFLITKISLSQYIFFEGLPLVGNLGSDLDPESLEILDVVRYAGYLAAILFLFLLAVVFYRRRDVFARRDMIAGSVCGIVLVLCISTSTSFAFDRAGKMKQWMDFRDRDTEIMSPQIDVLNLNAQVHLEPARNLTVSAELTATVLPETLEDFLVVWLNPGFTISEVKVDGIQVESVFDGRGALRVELPTPLEHGQKVQLSLEYQGKPNLDFGYFDSSTDVTTMPYWDQMLSYMGDVHGIFSSRFVALPKEVNWLPTPFLPLYEQRTLKDFVVSTIALTLPEDWEAALPGRKIALGDEQEEQYKTYEFTSDTPISSVELFAGPLVALSREIGGVNFEVLLSERQLSRQELLGESIDDLTDALAESTRS